MRTLFTPLILLGSVGVSRVVFGDQSTQSTSSSYFNIFSVDDAIPTHFIKSILDETQRVTEWSDKQTSFMHGKKPTFWFDVGKNQRPRNYIELSIQLLFQYTAHCENLVKGHQSAVDTIIGAEWWVQNVSSSDGIGFHYDKGMN